MTGTAGERVRAASVGGEPLPAELRSFFEPRFGQSLSFVRLHVGGAAEEAARAVDARAFTLGRNVVFGRGEYAPESAAGRRLLAHELAHAIQQRDAAGPPFQGGLQVSAPGDPYERAADMAADAVLGGGSPAPAGQVPGALVQRQVTRTCNRGAVTGDTTEVRCSDGAEYEVRTVVVTGIVPATQGSAAGGLDRSTLYLQIRVCRGRNEVQILTSMDVAQPLQQLIQNVLQHAPGIAGVRIEPEMQISWARSRDFELEVYGGPILVGGAPRVGGQGGVRVQRGRAYGEINVGSDPTLSGPGGAPELHGTIRGGVQTGAVRDVDCHTEKTTVQYLCRPVTHTTATPADDVQVYVFFEYATSRVIAPTPRFLRGNQDLAGASLAQLATDGYRAQAIDSHTSPEGPRGAPRRPGGFVGNDELSVQRATAANTWLRTVCPECIGTPVQIAPQSELYSSYRRSGVELEGDPLTEHARRGFLGQANDPADPLRRSQHDVLATLTPSRQRAELYPLLRRAVIHLHREGVPSRRESGPSRQCPPDVRDAMQRR